GRGTTIPPSETKLSSPWGSPFRSALDIRRAGRSVRDSGVCRDLRKRRRRAQLSGRPKNVQASTGPETGDPRVRSRTGPLGRDDTRPQGREIRPRLGVPMYDPTGASAAAGRIHETQDEE